MVGWRRLTLTLWAMVNFRVGGLKRSSKGLATLDVCGCRGLAGKRKIGGLTSGGRTVVNSLEFQWFFSAGSLPNRLSNIQNSENIIRASELRQSCAHFQSIVDFNLVKGCFCSSNSPLGSRLSV